MSTDAITAPVAPAANLPRVFEFNGTRLADPDDEMTPDQVKKIYAATYPALTNASITGPVTQDDMQVFTFKAAVATKG